MNQRVVVSLSAVALVAVAAGGAALAARSSGSSHTPKTITIQGADVGASATTMAASAPAAFMGPNPNFTFVLSGDLPLLDGDRPAWHLPANPTVDLGTIATLAKTLGVDGEVKAVDGGWQVGDQSTGHGLFVSKAAGLPWYYSNNANLKDGYVCPAVTSVPGDGGVMLTTLPPDCTGPPPPVGVPTKDEALAKAGELLKALGIDASSFSITANASEWSADVQAMPNLDGITAQRLMSSFSFGGEGKLQFANGYLLAPEKADSYPRIGTTKAFELLKSGEGFSVGYATDSGGGVATVAPVVTTELPASETTFATTVGTNCMGTTRPRARLRPQARSACVRPLQQPRRPGDDSAVPVDTLRAPAAHDRGRGSADVAVGDHVWVDRVRLRAGDHDPRHGSRRRHYGGGAAVPRAHSARTGHHHDHRRPRDASAVDGRRRLDVARARLRVHVRRWRDMAGTGHRQVLRRPGRAGPSYSRNPGGGGKQLCAPDHDGWGLSKPLR